MAYVDENGLILIDDAEVAEDIKRLNAVLELLEEALRKINQIASINSSFKGDTAEAISSSTVEMTKKLNEQKEKIEEEISYINEVVERYKTIDANMKNQINSKLTGEIFNNG